MFRVNFFKLIIKYSIYILYIFIISILPTPSIEAEGNEINFCKPPWDLDKISSCVIENHPAFRVESLRLKEIQGRKKISGYYFPSNPNVSSYVSRRNATESANILSTSLSQANNFQLMVTQEIYVNGKREKAIQIADEEFRAQVFRLESVRRNIYFQALSSIVRYKNLQKEESISLNLYLLAKDLTTVARARVREGIAPGMDESLSESEELRMAKIWKISKRKLEQTRGEIYLLLSLPLEADWKWNPSFSVSPNFPKDKDEIIKLALENRPEISLSDKEIKLAMLRLEEVRLQKIPNISLGAFAQNDGFNERVVGGQISLPLTVWRDYEGESLVAKAKGEQAIESKEIVSRLIKQEVINAISNYLTLKEEYALYESSILDRTDADLNHIREALKTGKIRVIDAINNQRILVQTRLNFIQTSMDYEQAQLELVRALGLNIDQLNIKENL